MTVWQCYPTFAPHLDQFVTIHVLAGVVVQVEEDSYVRTGDTLLPYDDKWHVSRADAWNALGDRLQELSDTLARQAEASWRRGSEEALT